MSLPNIFQLPECSAHGSYPTTFLRELPRIPLGLFTFGPQDLTPMDFHPMSSVYMEPVFVLMLPGVVICLFLLLSCCCFCYRRYRLGLCGEPIPTVTAYTPREIAVTRAVALAAFVASLGAAGLATLVANHAYDSGFDDIVEAGYATEVIINSSFAVGDQLLSEALEVNTLLDGYASLVTQYADVGALDADLKCVLGLLAALPNGKQMLYTATALGAASGVVPHIRVTDKLFADLRRPQQLYPLLVPPLTASLSTLQLRVAGLPALPTLASRLARVNTSVVNTTGVPSRIATALVSVNASLAGLPNLTLLEERLTRVAHTQTGDTSHLCSNIPIGWQPGDVTECDLLRAQLREARAALEETDAEAPLGLFASYEALAADFPPLDDVASALVIERDELLGCPNLTRTEDDYAALDVTISGWDPDAIGDAIAAVAAAATALANANTSKLTPELRTVAAALPPLECARRALVQLETVNASLLQLPEAVHRFHERAYALDGSLRAIPRPNDYINSLVALRGALDNIPPLANYLTGVGGISKALVAMPPSATLLSALRSIERERPLAPQHEGIINVSSALHAAMTSLPTIAPFRTSLQDINASRAIMPPLISRCLAAIEAYDDHGDTSGLAIVDETRDAVVKLASQMAARPDETLLRQGLHDVDAEFNAMPPTQPSVEQVAALDGALQGLPALTPYLTGLADVLEAVEATPSVDLLRDRWNDVKTRLGDVPALATVQQPLEGYAFVQSVLPSPPTKLLDGALTLHRKLSAVPTLVSDGKGAVSATHDGTRGETDTLLLALFGEDMGTRRDTGYTARLQAMKQTVRMSWWGVLLGTFGVPIVISGVTVLACITRTGRPALYAGHALMVVLPFYALLGASIELPMTIMLHDACEAVPFLTQRLSAFLALSTDEGGLGFTQFNTLADPLYGWVTGCPAVDPLATFYTPLVHATANATADAARELGALQLRPEARARVVSLAAAAAQVAETAGTVHGMLDCGGIHVLYEDVHTAICCDVAYAFTATWTVRLITAASILASLVASVAGYKRFRRKKDLWGPYASIEALEVGSYL